MIGVVPFAPDADEPCLNNCNYFRGRMRKDFVANLVKVVFDNWPIIITIRWLPVINVREGEAKDTLYACRSKYIKMIEEPLDLSALDWR